MADGGNDQDHDFYPWIRVNLAIEVFIKKGLLCFLHNTFGDPSYTGLPVDPVELYSHMENFKNDKQNELREVLSRRDWDRLCPTSAGKSNSNDWDVTLIMVVITNSSQLPAPDNSWFKKLCKFSPILSWGKDGIQ